MIGTELITAAAWFTGGVFVYRWLARMLHYIHGITFLREINEQTIKLIGSLESDLMYIHAMKYNNMIETGVEDKNVELAKKLDELAIKAWRKACVEKFFSFYPSRLHPVLPFKNYEEALTVLTDNYKKAVKEQEDNNNG